MQKMQSPLVRGLTRTSLRCETGGVWGGLGLGLLGLESLLQA